MNLAPAPVPVPVHVGAFCPQAQVSGVCCEECEIGRGCTSACAAQRRFNVAGEVPGGWYSDGWDGFGAISSVTPPGLDPFLHPDFGHMISCCPLLRVAGTCCESCSRGAPCAGAVAGANEVGAGSSLGTKAVPWDDVAAMNEAVERFNQEIAAGAAQVPADKAAGFFLPWNMWHANWQVWYFNANQDAEHRASVFLGIPKMVTDVAPDSGGESYYTAFQRLASEFNGKTQEWKSFGGQTSVAPIDTRSPLEQGFGSLTSAASSAAGNVAAILVYAVAATAVVAVGFLAWPYLLRAIAGRRAAA